MFNQEKLQAGITAITTQIAKYAGATLVGTDPEPVIRRIKELLELRRLFQDELDKLPKVSA